MTRLTEAPPQIDTLPRSRSSQVTHPFIKRPSRWKHYLCLGLWVVLWLAVADTAINLLFAYPQAGQTPSSLERYFDYGRSIEGKLNRMVGQTPATSDPIIEAGWIDPASWQDQPTERAPGDDRLVAVYGMSFSDDVGQALVEIDDKVTLRSLGGPTAPPNHTFATFLADKAGRKADVAVFGILASSVERMRSLSGTSWTYEHPAPYSYPYYQLQTQPDGSQALVAVEPVIDNAADFVDSFNQKDERWQAFQAQMQRYDRPYDPLVFQQNVTDRSALVRLMRRGWANRGRALTAQGLHDPAKGFNPNAPEIKTLKVMLTEFAATARASGQIPVVLLIHNQGYRQDLYDVLAADLQKLDVEVVSTHTLEPADDPSNFISDGHFTPEANREIARALQALIRSLPPGSETAQRGR